MTKKKILIAFGDKVRELRKEKGLSQEELSFKADLHRTYIGMIERAEKNITLTNIEKIAKALDVKVKDLFDETR
ncbi:MAG: transcriptional regulator [Bacteroidetes bacterium 37-13]|nr:MAG: transcriptional regulator [Bacteroidetes bacterium 37-13]